MEYTVASLPEQWTLGAIHLPFWERIPTAWYATVKRFGRSPHYLSIRSRLPGTLYAWGTFPGPRVPQ